ncbi:porin family protein [bacterium]|nr:porin family protein [bacterium]MBU1958566.1 porin family protein [bacterium]
MKKIFIVIIPILVLSKPVKIDEILTEKNTFRIDTSLSYSNIQRTDGGAVPLQYQTQNGDFVTIPTFVGDSKSNQDYINYGFTLRYGVTKDIEIFSSLNMHTSDTHFSNSGQFDTQHEKGFNSLLLGATYQIKHENDTPSLLIGTNIDVIDRTNFSGTDKNVNFKGYTFFVTSYYTVDPIVFLVNSSYRYNLEKKYNNHSVENAKQFSLSPQIFFAVNPYTSLSTGVKYNYRGSTRVDNTEVSSSGSSMTYLLGTSYEINAKSTLNIDADYSNSMGISQNSLSMGLSYKF